MSSNVQRRVRRQVAAARSSHRSTGQCPSMAPLKRARSRKMSASSADSTGPSRISGCALRRPESNTGGGRLAVKGMSRAHILAEVSGGGAEQHGFRGQPGPEGHGAAFAAARARLEQRLRARTSPSPTTCCRSGAACRARPPAPPAPARRRRSTASSTVRPPGCTAHRSMIARLGAVEDVADAVLQRVLDGAWHLAGQHHVEARLADVPGDHARASPGASTA